MMKLPIREIIKQEYDVKIDKNEAMSNEYLIKQGDSIIFDQIKRLRGYTSSHISEMVLIVAKKNPKTEKELKRILDEGFYLNGIHYNRFGKSASQGKDGITAFVCDEIYDYSNGYSY